MKELLKSLLSTWYPDKCNYDDNENVEEVWYKDDRGRKESNKKIKRICFV